MFFLKDELEIRKLVTYHTIYTSIYFPLLLLILYWTNGIYLAGQYEFNSVIFFITIAELVKYFSSALYYRTQDVNLSKKCDDRSTGAFIRSIFSRHRIREGFKNIIVISLMIFIYSTIAVLYGAEVFSKYEETFMFASLLTVLTVLPACLNLGSHSIIALLLGSKPINKLESLLYQNLYLTVFGAWLGAFVIPLDWDRPWQKWPIPCTFGAMIGYALSHFVMMFKVRGNNKKKSKGNLKF